MTQKEKNASIRPRREIKEKQFNPFSELPETTGEEHLEYQQYERPQADGSVKIINVVKKVIK